MEETLRLLLFNESEPLTGLLDVLNKFYRTASLDRELLNKQALVSPSTSPTFPFFEALFNSSKQRHQFKQCVDFTDTLKKLKVLRIILAQERYHSYSAYRRDFYLTIFSDHDIVTVSVTNTQYISSYTVASTRQSKFFNGSIQVISKIKKKKKDKQY